jgi:hypothetical protein
MPDKPMTDEEFFAICHRAYKGYKGDIRDLERAIGTLFVGRFTGWKPIYLMQDRKSLKKYESFLGIRFQDVLVDEGTQTAPWRGHSLREPRKN